LNCDWGWHDLECQFKSGCPIAGANSAKQQCITIISLKPDLGGGAVQCSGVQCDLAAWPNHGSNVQGAAGKEEK